MVRFFIVTTLKHFFFHFINANRILYYLGIASNFFVFSIIEVLVLIEHFKLLDNPLEDFSSLMQSTVRTAVVCFI